jgi:GH43 family beta-xylosidase
MISKPEHDWEKIGNPLVNEGPEVLTHNGDLFIIYSASGSWTDHYCLGQLKLVGSDPLNPKSWRKKPTPVFRGTETVFSPGHASFTKSPDGTEDWIVYHTAKHRGAGWDRCTRMQPFKWDAQGDPIFGQPIADTVEIPAPSQ